MIMTQEEFVTQLREMNEDIARAWLSAERVTALKLATRVARLLCDTSVPSFYPTLFVLVTEVMDTMGRLVFDRIRNKAEREDDGTFVAVLPPHFTADDVRQDAKDTCVNWFYKIGAVRDLLPRCYMEMALLKCYHFLQRDPPRRQVARLAAMLRGLGDPLAAAYARCYLARRGQALLPGETDYLESMLHDFMPQYTPLSLRPAASALASGMPPADYLALLDPALEWQLSRLCAGAGAPLLERVLSAAGAAPPLAYCGVLLGVLPAWFVAAHARRLAALVRASEDGGAGGAYARGGGAAQASCYRRLGEKLGEAPPPQAERLPMLRDVWRAVGRLPRLGDYLHAADVWVEYSLRHFGPPELDALLGDVRAHVAAAPPGDAAAAGLASLLQRVLLHVDDLAAVLRLAHFVPLLDTFPPGSHRQELLRRALGALTAPSAPPLADPVAIHFAFEAARSLHDALDPFSPEGDRRDAGRACARVLQRVHFGRDLEAHLNFLVDCRAAFGAMPVVQEQCVHAAAALAMTALAAMRGRHNPRTHAFAKACVAFAQVTAPSLPAGPRRAHLFVAAAQASLVNGLLPHADALLRCAVTDVADAGNPPATGGWADVAPGEAEEGMLSLARVLSSTLVVTPGHPERGPFYLLHGFSRALAAFPWAPGSDAKPRAQLALVQALCALRQRALPYRLEGVESNDVLYAGDDGYAGELAATAARLVEEVTAELAEPDAAGGAADRERERRRAARRLDVANTLLTCFRAGSRDVRTAVDDLVSAAAEVLPSSDAYLRSTIRFAKARFKAAKAEASLAAAAAVA
jgi:hypothetical protein